ncbi:large ribosomal subunit protein eL6-like isoform X2 [Amphiura filiformis]
MGDDTPKKGKKHSSRQKWLTGGIPRYSKSQMYKRAAKYKRKHVVVKKEKVKPPKFIEKPIGGEKNGGTRQVRVNKGPKYYPTEDRPRNLHNRKKQCFNEHKHTLRPSLTPGTVLILLCGRFKGKRVIFLKQLKSGSLLITGPIKVNGVPMRRMNPIYVIATSTKIDVSGVKIPKHINDDYFKKPAEKKGKGGGDEIFDTEKKEKKELPEERKNDQKEVDSQLLPLIDQTEHLKGYLKMPFSLRTHQYPHKMVF